MTKYRLRVGTYDAILNSTCVATGGLDLQKYIWDTVYQLTLTNIDCCGRTYDFGGSGSFSCADLADCSEEIQTIISREYLEDTLASSFPFATYNDGSNTFTLNSSAVTAIITREYVEDLLGSSFPNLSYNDSTNSFDMVASMDAGNAFMLGSDSLPFVQEPTGINGLNGTTQIKLGGTLTEDTLVSGDNDFPLEFLDLSRFTIESSNSAGTAKSRIDSSEVLSTPFLLKHYKNDNSTYAQLLLDADGNLTGIEQVNGTATTRIGLTPSEAFIQYTPVAGTTRYVKVNNTGIYADGLNTKVAETKVLWYNETSKEILEGMNAGAAALTEYTHGGVRFIATGTGITAAWASGVCTITIPGGITLISAHVILADATNVQTGADGGGSTNWIQVKFMGTYGNTSASDMRVPSVQKTFYASGTPAVNNAYSIDIDNNPNIAIVGVGTNSITIRISNLTIPNGAQFTFTGI